jgi:small-conductance mechanosensitive channel
MDLSIFQQDFLGNSWERWALATSLFLGILLLGLALRSLIAARLGKISASTDSQLDDLVALLLRKTHFVFFFLVALHLSVGSLVLAPKVEKIIHVTFFLVLFTQVGLWASRALSFLGNNYVNKTLTVDAGRATTIRAMLFFGRIFVWVTMLLLLLDNWGIKVAPFLAGLGIGGIAIAFAVQGILADLFASLSIVLDKPFVIGDAIGVDSDSGTVEYIGLKTTRIRRLSGEQLVFSNSELLKSRIHNYKRMFERRSVLRFRVLYETPVEKLEAIPGWLKSAVESMPKTRFGRAHFAEFGQSALEYEMEYFVTSPDYGLYMDTQQKISFEILRKFQAEGVEFAYPTQKIFVESGKNERP